MCADCAAEDMSLSGGEGVREGEGAFVEAAADDDAGDTDGLELADVGVPTAGGGKPRGGLWRFSLKILILRLRV
jgi:hypothetical protein